MIETIACLWARSDRAERWYSALGDDDGPWTFWETYERIECAPLASQAYADALTEDRSDG